jgi:hypothetical protein
MRVLVATAATQGQRPNDFCFATEGELVCRALACDRGQADLDGECGCGRSLMGVDSGQATTTAKVVWIDMGLGEYLDRLARGCDIADPDELTALAVYEAGCLLLAAVQHELGAVLEFRPDADEDFHPRTVEARRAV